MKRFGIILAVTIGVIVALLLIGRFTGAIGWYKNPTPANEPTLKMGGSFFFSNLKKPSRGNFIVFKNGYTDSMLVRGSGADYVSNNYVKRLCGMAGDVLEMKDGVLFVNGKNFDRDYNLKAYYATTVAEMQKTGLDLDSMGNAPSGDFRQMSKDTILVNLDDKLAAELKKIAIINRYFMIETEGMSRSFEWLAYRGSCTVDNWGPITVPADHYFVLGDNRQNALDSRYFGFVPKKSWLGTVLWK